MKADPSVASLPRSAGNENVVSEPSSPSHSGIRLPGPGASAGHVRLVCFAIRSLPQVAPRLGDFTSCPDLVPPSPLQTVLVDDDERSIRLILQQALEGLSLHVETTADGPEALDQVVRTDYDLMLLDLRMPGLDGLEVLQRTRQQAPDLPIVIVTAHGTVKNAVQAMCHRAVCS